MNTCIVPACSGRVYAYGHCKKHHRRLQKYGSTDLPQKPTMLERLMRRVEKTEACWLWVGGGISGKRPRGSFSTPWTTTPSRASWILHNGPVPAGLYVCHRCDNPLCVRPSHLFLGTAKENTQDMLQKGRHRASCHAGEPNPNASLAAQQVIDIRRASAQGAETKTLARKYGVSVTAIQRIINGSAWRHLLGDTNV